MKRRSLLRVPLWFALAPILFCCLILAQPLPAQSGQSVDRRPIAALPLIELPAASNQNDILAIILSGDGGWADLDKVFGGAFQQRGISTVGFDCFKYFWTTRQPAEVSRDMEAVLRYYLPAWGKKRVLLVGYSFGACWLPFLVNRLPADLLPQVQLCVLLGPSSFVNVEVHLRDWMGDELRPGALKVLPEALLIDLPVLCVWGQEEKDSICPLLTGARVKQLRMPGGHHFDYQYAPIIDTIFTTMETVKIERERPVSGKEEEAGGNGSGASVDRRPDPAGHR